MTLIALGLIAVVALCLIYIGWNIYRGAKAVIEDPDSADLFDGK